MSYCYHALTGLGPVQSLTAIPGDDGIELTWSPPKATATTTRTTSSALSYTVAYSSLRSGQSRTTVTTTPSTSWRIRATLGDAFLFTVRPVSDSAGSGDRASVTAGLDCELIDTNSIVSMLIH